MKERHHQQLLVAEMTSQQPSRAGQKICLTNEANKAGVFCLGSSTVWSMLQMRVLCCHEPSRSTDDPTFGRELFSSPTILEGKNPGFPFSLELCKRKGSTTYIGSSVTVTPATLIAVPTLVLVWLHLERRCVLLLHGDAFLILASMEQLFDAFRRAQVKKGSPPDAILDMVHEWKDMGENLVKSLVGCVSDIESREKNLSLVGESLEKRLKDLEEREREFDSRKRGLALEERGLSPYREDLGKELELREEKLDELLKLVREHIESLEVAQSEAERLRLMESEKLTEIEKREGEVDFIRGSLEKRLKEIERREKEFDSFQHGKLRELVLKEELFSRKREQFDKEIKLVNEKFGKVEKLGSGLIKRLELAPNVLEGMKLMLDERCEEIESWEAATHKSLQAIVNEADLIRESLEIRFKEFEKMEREINSLQEDKMQKLGSAERELSIIRKEILKEIKLRDEKLTEQQELGHKLLECFEGIVAKKFKEIEAQELTLNVAGETLDASAEDSDLSRESINIRLQELKKREEEFRLYQEQKMRELMMEEEKLTLIRGEFIQELKFREEEFDKQEKLVHGLLERLELAENNVKNMIAMVSERFKEISLKEIELNRIRNSVEGKMDELEIRKKKSGEQERGIKAKEDSLISRGNEIVGKKKELELKEVSLGSLRKELECKDKHLEELDSREKKLNSTRESKQTCFKEHLASNNLYKPERYLNHAGYLAEKDQQTACKELELNSKQIGHPRLTDSLDAQLRTEPEGSVDLRHAVDAKSLEMVINNTGKDLELIGDEIFKLLLHSSDPAKLVLDAVEGLYMPHLGEGVMDLNMRRACLMLDQLTKMSPKIQPCVREAAIKLAAEWKSKMRTIAENPLEVSGFLQFVAAYNLSSCFPKDELLSFVKTSVQHKQAPELCRILGLTEDMHGLIQNLINEKQYLLASTYICECELETVFPQAAVLDYYVKHSKMLAKAIRKREHDSAEAQDKAIDSEIKDLHFVIRHIVKYGLEYEYSLDPLTLRINQLEKDREGLRNRWLSSSSNPRRQETKKRPAHANKSKAQQRQHEATREAHRAPKAQVPDQGSEEGSYLARKSQHWQSKTRKRHATRPFIFHEPCSQQEQTMIHMSSAHKRLRANILSDERRSHLQGGIKWRFIDFVQEILESVLTIVPQHIQSTLAPFVLKPSASKGEGSAYNNSSNTCKRVEERGMKEIKLNCVSDWDEQLLEELDCRQKNLNSVGTY
ncbi:FRIGIDA-like protein 5 [Sesamum angolense]|uniref:FRIGIDA-like protein 5 n=1 Tax=Sesamum angolense TaxID=2727404 RepID=A0AAE1X9H9_9LAMI|nr:FRIGIDA-like protein 5 [Sesamum angolense]